MRKTKVLFILFLVVVISILPFSHVNAHSVELDPNSLISFPMMIVNGNGNIIIKKSETEYSLYYQIVEISSTEYSKIEQTKNKGKTEINSIKLEMEALEVECDNLETIFNDAYNAYKTKLDSGENDEELKKLKNNYETSQINYKNKTTEYNTKLKEYNTKVDEVNEKIKELTPTYIENNWTKTNDGRINVDLSKFSGEKTFAVWAKLVCSNGTIFYDESTYTMSGTKVDEIKVESVKLDKKTLSITEGNNYTLKATIRPENATNKILEWSSSNEKVAKVENGKVMAISEGTTNITVTTKDGKYIDSCKVTVTKNIVRPTNKDEKADSLADDTTAKGNLPKTGNFNFIIIGVIILVSIIGFVIYKKIKYMNF